MSDDGNDFNGKPVELKEGSAIVGEDYSVEWHSGKTDHLSQMLLWDQTAMTTLLVMVIGEARAEEGEVDEEELEKFKQLLGM